MCAAWEAELAIWQGDWERARTALGRADGITAATDEILLELRLTALAMRLEADEYDWLRTSAQPRDRREVAGVADARIHRAEAFLERIERAVDTVSQPFRRTLELARAERSRLDDPPPAAPWAAIAGSAGHGHLRRRLRALAPGRGAARRRRRGPASPPPPNCSATPLRRRPSSAPSRSPARCPTWPGVPA